ncbi:hypothetical protein INS49_006156 [Diaporthe citri]|uniref:uncharacterized protein n=1 Tax=Diaporthe citri TaxID=83186 RepID=UPI001C7FC4CD|nr:uncharacterized protein INS49_006156 [Diaporthe citri]KAG6364554.1 hypothetical protein INS49_006156 [Diaporthe citri]
MSSSNTTAYTTPVPSRSPSPAASLDDIEAYRPLFRRRRPPISKPPVPCLCCAIKGMHCVYYKGEVRCQRCERNGEEFCIYQRQDLTRPESPMTQEQLEQREEESRSAPPPRHLWLPHRAPPQPEPLQCMVYSLDPELSRDRRRLLGVATQMLQDAEGSTYVHGTPLGDAQVRGFALPSWHGNDCDDNKADPEYRVRTHAHFFERLGEENKAAAAQRSRRLGLERRRVREEKADCQRLKREMEKEETEAEGEAEGSG